MAYVLNHGRVHAVVMRHTTATAYFFALFSRYMNGYYIPHCTFRLSLE